MITIPVVLVWLAWPIAFIIYLCSQHRKSAPVAPGEDEPDIAGEATAKLITPPTTHWIDLKPTMRWYPMPESELDAAFLRDLDHMFVFRDATPGNVRTIRTRDTHWPDDGGNGGAA